MKSRSNLKAMVTRSKIMVWCERFYHKEYTCEIWQSYVWHAKVTKSGETRFYSHKLGFAPDQLCLFRVN